MTCFPYFIKDQTASTTLNPTATPGESDASVRNGFIHHRTETYSGFSDPEISLGWRKRDLFGPGSIMRVALGFTVPIGNTEEDPWILGANGQEHLHIQFGNGTFDPLLEFYLGKPISEKWAWNFYSKARLPFYHNSKGYRGFSEVTASPRVTYLVNKDFSLSRPALSANISATPIGKKQAAMKTPVNLPSWDPSPPDTK